MALMASVLFLPLGLMAEESPESVAALAAALKPVKVTLAQGLAASAAQGTPISGKFELDDSGKLQLSVYTVKDGTYFEVIVNHKSGKVAKSEKIADAGDLTHAQSQDQAIGKANKSLAKAVAAAVKANPGYRAIGAVAELDGDKPVAKITLLKGKAAKEVTEKLGG
jgi:uncharacterized membrane protein YkoI